jgi:hypothetical protein
MTQTYVFSNYVRFVKILLDDVGQSHWYSEPVPKFVKNNGLRCCFKTQKTVSFEMMFDSNKTYF